MEGKARTGEGASWPWGLRLLLAARVLYACREEIQLVIRFRLRIKKRLYRVGCGLTGNRWGWIQMGKWVIEYGNGFGS